MIKLENKTNVNAPDVDFPFGGVRDKTVSLSGTKYDKNTMSDIFQFFEKMFSESGIVANGLVDNETNGWQLYEAFRLLSRPYKVYTALLTQSGTNAPVATVIENTLGVVPVWSYSAVGVYLLTSASTFVSSKTAVFIQNGLQTASGSYFCSANIVTTSVIGLYSTNGSLANTNGLINKQTIEIRVYD